MVGYMKVVGYFMYIYVAMYGIVGIFGFFSGFFGNDFSLVLMSLVFLPIAYLLHLFAQAHLRMARRTQGYINFCKAFNITDDKERSEMFFRQYKLVKR